MEKKLDANYTKMLWAILNKSWRQHPTKQQLYGHLPPITKTVQVRRTRHVGHCRRSRDEPISDVLLWTPSHGQAKAGRLARTYIQQLCADSRCRLEDLPEAMDDREGWRERVRNIPCWWRDTMIYMQVTIFMYNVCILIYILQCACVYIMCVYRCVYNVCMHIQCENNECIYVSLWSIFVYTYVYSIYICVCVCL